MQVFKLQAYLRSVRAVHICANVLLSGAETNIMAASRTDFIDELFLKSS